MRYGKNRLLPPKQTAHIQHLIGYFSSVTSLFAAAAIFGYKSLAAIAATAMGLVLVLQFRAEVKASGFDLKKFIIYFTAGIAASGTIIFGMFKSLAKGLESGNIIWVVIGFGVLGIVLGCVFLFFSEYEWHPKMQRLNATIAAHPNGREFDLSMVSALFLVVMAIYFFYPQLVLDAFAWISW